MWRLCMHALIDDTVLARRPRRTQEAERCNATTFYAFFELHQQTKVSINGGSGKSNGVLGGSSIRNGMEKGGV